jgi:hypothetical protein
MIIGNNKKMEKNMRTTLIAGDLTNALTKKANARSVPIYNHENNIDLKKSEVIDSVP